MSTRTVARLKVDIVGNAQGLTSEVKKAEASLRQMKPDAAGMDRFLKSGKDGLAGINKQIQDQISSLYKLRGELTRASRGAASSGPAGAPNAAIASALQTFTKGSDQLRTQIAQAVGGSVAKAVAGSALGNAIGAGVGVGAASAIANGGIGLGPGVTQKSVERFQRNVDTNAFNIYRSFPRGVRSEVDANPGIQAAIMTRAANMAVAKENSALTRTIDKIVVLGNKARNAADSVGNLGEAFGKKGLGKLGVPEGAAGKLGRFGAIAGGTVLVAAALGRLGDGFAEARQSARESGVSGSGFGNAMIGIGNATGLGGVATGLGEFASVFGAPTSISDIKAETDGLTDALQFQETLRRQIRDHAKDTARQDAQSAQILNNLKTQRAIMMTGGIEGRVLGIRQSAADQTFSAGQERDQRISTANKALEALNDEQRKATEKIRNAQSAGLATPEMDKEYQTTITRTEQAKKALQGDIARANADYTARTGEIATNAKLAEDIARGVVSDTKAQDDAFENLGRSIRGLAVDDVDALRKAFAETKPDAAAMAKYNAELDKFSEAKKKIEAQQTVKGLEDQAQYAGLKPEEAVVARLKGAGLDPAEIAKAEAALKGIKAGEATVRARLIVEEGGDAFDDEKTKTLNRLIRDGVNGGLVAKVRVEMELGEAAAQYRQWMDQVKGIDAQIAAARESDSMKKIGAEVEAERRAAIDKIRASGGTPQQIADAERKINDGARENLAKRLELERAQRGAAMRENLRNSKDILRDKLKEIADLRKSGEIDDETAKRGIKDALKNYQTANKTPDAPMLEAGSGAALRAAFVAAGKVRTSDNPMLAEAKKTNDLLADIKDGVLDDPLDF